jgi:hypothetical protein
MAGAPGIGGVGGAPPNSCPTFMPRTPLLTGSRDTVAAPSNSYSYAAPGLMPPSVLPSYDSAGVWQTLEVNAKTGVPTDPDQAYVGFGVPVFGCVNASAYQGVTFTVTGDLGTCLLQFEVVARNNNAVQFGGSCTATTCYGPFSAPLSLGTSVVKFADMSGGNPNSTLDATQINDIQWQLTAPTDGVTAPCAARFTVSDIAFVP